MLAWLVAPAAAPVPPPVPAGPERTAPGPTAPIDRTAALQFAAAVDRLAQQVAALHARRVAVNDLLEGAVRGLYEEAGRSVPPEVLAAVRRATPADRVQILADARVALGHHPNLSGLKSFFAAVNGFKHATDPYCQLVGPRTTTFASVDQDFGIGIELEGVTGLRWAVYQAESQALATGQMSFGWFGPPVRPEQLPVPATLPWKIRRVVPGSPAQKAGLRPGDLITQLNGTAVTPESAPKLFALFANTRPAVDPRTGLPVPRDWTLTVCRNPDTVLTVSVKSAAYTPECLFGVLRVAEDRWDCLIDRRYKIGYIRVGPIESGSDQVFAEMLERLAEQGCRGLILDLRWCPGGYVDPAMRIASAFVREGTVIAKMEYPNRAAAGPVGDLIAPPGSGRYAGLPLALLVGPETTGGGELIASALRDNDDGSRCVVVGQRSAGRAAIQNVIDAGFFGLQFRVTTGTSHRPTGKSRQRLPDSQPTDDWGIRPDPGLEVPLTPDKLAELRLSAELHALRPFDSREALPFDDPDADPYRLTALAYLRKKLGLPR